MLVDFSINEQGKGGNAFLYVKERKIEKEKEKKKKKRENYV